MLCMVGLALHPCRGARSLAWSRSSAPIHMADTSADIMLPPRADAAVIPGPDVPGLTAAPRGFAQRARALHGGCAAAVCLSVSLLFLFEVKHSD